MISEICPIKLESAKEQYNLTAKQVMFIQYILEEGLYAEPGFSDIQVTDIAEWYNWPIPTAKGVLGSLVKKGFLTIDGDGNNIGDNFIQPTILTYCLWEDEDVVTEWREQLA